MEQQKEEEQLLKVADGEESPSNDGSEDNDANRENIPNLSHFQIFRIFLWFGLRAWGGPMAQIDMIKQQLVNEEKWITPQRFNRVLAVYQVLPGPEATELCCYFGMIAKGRLGSVLAGLGFILPGFCLMLLISWIYTTWGLESIYVKASFTSIQPTVAALVFRATQRIAEHAFQDSATHQFSFQLLGIAGLGALTNVMKMHFFISLSLCGTVYALLYRKRLGAYLIAALILALVAIVYILVAVFVGLDKTDVTIGALVGSNSLHGLFLLGLLAGLLTFGGAYTAIPFVQQDAVIRGQWLTAQQFLDGIAIATVLPAPLVIFSTFVGYVGGGFFGAILMTLGMFLPSFSFTLIGHNFFERLIKNPSLMSFLDGVTAGVIGLILIAAFQLMKNAVTNTLTSLLFFLSLRALYQFKHRSTGIIVVLASAIVGQVLFVE